MVDLGLNDAKLLADYEADLCYYPPEKISKKGYKTNSDVYSLGCILYFMITGKNVYEYKDLVELQMKQKKCQPNFSHMNDEMKEIITKMI